MTMPTTRRAKVSQRITLFFITVPFTPVDGISTDLASKGQRQHARQPVNLFLITVLRKVKPRLLAQRSPFETVSLRRDEDTSHTAMMAKTPKKKLRRIAYSFTRIQLFQSMFHYPLESILL